MNTPSAPNYLLQQKACWITWEIQVRNRSMAAMLGIPLHELIVKKSRWIKYPILIAKTLNIIFSQNIKLLFVQNPSIVLSFLAICLKKIITLKVVVDAHNAGIYPLEGRSKLLNNIAKFIATNADIIIVSNNYLAEVVQQWGATPFVMPDPIPDTQNHQPVTSISFSKPYIFFVCTWADDEPYFEVIKAAQLINNTYDIYITGNFKKRLTEDDIRKIPGNVKLLGFVSEADYINYFSHAYVAMDLTTRDNCLVCGAYEAMALNIPMILSESQVNRETFANGFIYSENNAAAISKAIQQITEERERLLLEIKNSEIQHRLKINEKIAALIKAVQ